MNEKNYIVDYVKPTLPLQVIAHNSTSYDSYVAWFPVKRND